ncbi:MAG: hypothetical protein SGJ19_14570 [Planctomycetia bacterium]|nr:hypothetical protein [Planctomycetia bacterium]
MSELEVLEIQLLRDEALQSTSQVIDLMNYTIGAALALVAAGCSLDDSLSGLIPLMAVPLVWACLVLVRARRLNAIRISTYLRAFAGSKFRWEGRLRHLRKMPAHPRIGFAPAMFWVLATTAAVCALVSLFLQIQRTGPIWPVAVVAAVGAVGIGWERLVVPLLGSKSGDDAFFTAWHKIQADEEKFRQENENASVEFENEEK